MALELHILTAIVGGCSFEELNDIVQLARIMEESARAACLTVLETRMKQFQPFGVTGVTILSQSHIAIHTWPELGKLFVDIASCSTADSSKVAFDALRSAFPDAVVESERRFSIAARQRFDECSATSRMIMRSMKVKRNSQDSV